MKTPFRSAVSVTASGNYIGNQRIPLYEFGALLGPFKAKTRRFEACFGSSERYLVRSRCRKRGES